jgi:hypothetical protein
MIKSLYNLSKQIHSHVNKLHLKKDFKIEEVKPFFEKYNSNDWVTHKNMKPIEVLASPNNFKRIPIIFPELDDINNDLYDMYLVEWQPFCSTGLQNHPDSSCLIKVLDGTINKQLFHSNGASISNKLLNKDDIELIHAEKELYRITNDNRNKAYSLHLYSPPIIDLEIELQHELKNRNREFFKNTPHLAKNLLHNLYNKK